MKEVEEKARKAKFDALKKGITALNKSLKKDNVIRFLRDDAKDVVYDCIPTGIMRLDAACSGTGWKRGIVVELFGPESSGKSLICQRAIAATQAKGGVCAYVDQEFTFDPQFATKLGVNCGELLISQPDSLQECFAVVDTLIDAGTDLIVLDSIAALVPEEELEGGVTDRKIGLIAGYMTQALRRWNPKLARSGGVLVCVNQMREKIGVLYGDPTTTPGGKALKFYSSIRIRVGGSAEGVIKERIAGEEVVVGKGIRTTCVKNKTAAPYKKAEFKVYFDGRKVDEVDELIEVALAKGLFWRRASGGELSAKGQFFTWPSVPEFRVRYATAVPEEVRKYPQIIEEIRAIVAKGNYGEHLPKYDDGEAAEDTDFDALIAGEAEGEEVFDEVDPGLT